MVGDDSLDTKKYIQNYFKNKQPKDYDTIMVGDKCPVCSSEDTDILAFSDHGIAKFDCINGHNWIIEDGKVRIVNE